MDYNGKQNYLKLLIKLKESRIINSRFHCDFKRSVMVVLLWDKYG